jgi:hypothetical protein
VGHGRWPDISVAVSPYNNTLTLEWCVMHYILKQSSVATPTSLNEPLAPHDESDDEATVFIGGTFIRMLMDQHII